MTRPRPRRRERNVSGPLADFGAFVASRRRTLELTQLDVADLADVGVSSVRNLEAGRTSPTLAVALRILDALGLTLVGMPHMDARTLTGSTVELRSSETGRR
ncbi:helix-turn-helix domain-containing protein [Nocardia sp. NPDC050793]|uniref:helix-turn-helix domain-containing protein n=1 Tax=Nocardia sp. NPDC050793 TaxID=3155159 RepID=UPI0033EC24A2